MFILVGPAGTGNTRVIAAVTELYKRLGVSHWLRCAALQGSIANAIGGATWHSWLGLGIKKGAKANLRKVEKNFDAAELIITDEFSMIPCKFLSDLILPGWQR